MTADAPTIVATSVGFRSTGRGGGDREVGPVHRYVARLANAGDSPRVCVLDTAGGDNPSTLTSVYAAFGREGWHVSHLALFPEPNVDDVAAHLHSVDVVWVTGGSVANLLAVWRAHRLRPVLRECWQAGVVLTGVSAGAVCWFAGGVTDAFGPPPRPVRDGLGLLPYAFGEHHHDPDTPSALSTFVAARTLPQAYAVDPGVAATFVGDAFHEAVTIRAGAQAWRITADGAGGVDEAALPTHLLTESGETKDDGDDPGAAAGEADGGDPGDS